MFSNVNYDYDVFVSDENDSVSSSCYSSDDEINGRKFILGNNILHSNPLEIISVRQINEINKINDNIKVNVCYEAQGAHYDECISDLEEEVCESDENSDNNTKKELYHCQSIMDYELPKIGRFQPKLAKQSNNVCISKLNDIGENCLRERRRRLEERKEVVFSSITEASTIQDIQTHSNSSSICQLSKSKTDHNYQTLVSSEVLSTLSIDVLTEFINSDKPLKEIVSKSKKQTTCNNKKLKNRKIKKCHVIESKCNLMNDIEKRSNSVISFDSNNGIRSEDNELYSKSIIETNLNKSPKSSINFDLTSDNKSIVSDNVDLEINNHLLISTKAAHDDENHLSQSSNLDIEIDKSSPIENNLWLEVANQTISSNLELNVDNKLTLSKNQDIKMTVSTTLPEFPVSINDNSHELSNLEFKKFKKSIIKNSELTAVSQTASIINSNKKSSEYFPSNSSFYVDQLLPSTKSKSIIFSSRTSQNFDKKLKKTNNFKSVVDTQKIQSSKSSEKIANDKCSSNKVVQNVGNTSCSLPNRLISEGKHRSILSTDWRVNTSYNPVILVDTEAILSSKSLSIIANTNNSLCNNELNIDNQSSSSQNNESGINNPSISSTYSKLSMLTVENQSELSQNLKPNLTPMYKSSTTPNSVSEKCTKVIIQEDIKKTIFNSFNRFSNYNFLCDDMVFQKETESDNLSTSYPKVSEDGDIYYGNSISVKSVCEDAVTCSLSKNDIYSKESTTSSIDSGFNETTDNKSYDNVCMKLDTIPISLNIFENDESSFSLNNTAASSCDSIKDTSKTQSFLANQDTSKTDQGQVRPMHCDNMYSHTTQKVINKKVNPFKQNYYCPNFSVQNREEISEFLNFQWLMFCEMHTLDNLI